MKQLLEIARQHRAVTASAALVGVLVIALLGWLFQPWQLFLDTEVDEAFPVSVSGQLGTTADATTDDTAADDTAAESEPAPEVDDASPEPAAEEPAAEEPAAEEPAAEEPAAEEPAAEEPAAEEPAATSPAPAEETQAPAEPVLLASGTFQDRSHPTSGTVGIFELADGRRVLRIEDLETDNGPDLFVYLSAASADAPAEEFDDNFANLGRLKGNIGSQNYEIPADVDLSAFRSVVIWCDRFDVAFGSAELQPA